MFPEYQRRRSGLSQRGHVRWPTIVLFLAAAGFGALLVSGFATERAKWEVAAGLNAAQQGDLDRAIELVQSAMDRAPELDRIKLVLARLLAENEQGELGVALCDEYLEKYPSNAQAYAVRSTCFLYLGQFETTLRDYQKSLAGELEKSPLQLNNLAYYRALARTELPQAARQIQEAIESERSSRWGCTYLVPLPVRSAVAAGLVSRHLGDPSLSRDVLDRQIELYQQRWETRNSVLTELVAQLMQGNFPPSRQAIDTTTGQRLEREVIRNGLGLLLATRALIHEDAGCRQEADSDRRRVQQLGFEFDALVQELPDDLNCLNVLEQAAVYLDTRGFVEARLPWQSSELGSYLRDLKMDGPGLFSSSQSALDDLDLAIAAAEIHHLALYSPLCNRYDIPSRQVESQRSGSRRMRAVLTYHRMEAHQKAGNAAAAKADAQRIRDLGLQPDASLF